MGLLGKIATTLLAVIVIAALVLGYLGFLPIVSDVMGSNSPRDLGVRTASVTGAQVNGKLGVTFTELPAENVGKATLVEQGEQQVSLRLNSEEITALVNDHESRWKYYPIEQVQVKINGDDTIEVSGLLRVDRFSGYADSIGLSENTRNMARPYLAYVQVNPSVYIKGTLEIGDATRVELIEVQVGRLSVPAAQAEPYIGYVESFVSRVTDIYQLHIRELYVENGELVVVGSIPTSVALSPSVNAVEEVGFWAPESDDAVLAFGSMTAFFAASNLLSVQLGGVAQYLSNLLPKVARSWLDKYVTGKLAGRSKVIVDDPKANALTLTRVEVVSYATTLVVLTVAYAYSGNTSVEAMLAAVPTIIVTSILIEFLRTYVLNLFLRSRGVWAENHIWGTGLAMFLVSTFAFKTPFSTPNRRVKAKAEKLGIIDGLVALNSVLLVTALAGGFYYLRVFGLSDVGRIGLGMCLLSAFLGSIPIKPLNGKTIWDWNKVVSIAVLLATFFINYYWVTHA